MKPLQLSADDAVFEAALQGEDELGMVVRAHIHIESALITLVDALLASPKHERKLGLDYAQRVSLAVALGLKVEYEQPLLALGTLRNSFAHKLGTRLTLDRVNSLYTSLSPALKKLVQESHDRARAKRPDSKTPAFKALAPRDQFMLMAVTLRALLHVASREVQGSDGNA